MKSFKDILSEVAQPKSEDEINFKAKHEIEKFDHPTAEEEQFTGGTKKAAKRKADYEVGNDEKVYEAMDPVNKKAAMGKFKNRKDQDIDNDGDVDSSDKYLHARRKAVTKAIHKEEAELDEAGIKTAYGTTKTNKYGGSSGKSIIPKRGTKAYDAWRAKNDEMHKKRVAMWKNEEAELDLSDFTIEEWEEFMESAEYDQLDEISKKTLGSYINKAHKDYDKQRTKQGAAYDKAERTGRDEDEDKGHEYGRKADKRTQGIKTAVSKLTKEDVEQIDEVSKKTLSSYIKKAVKDKNAEYDKAERAKSDDKAMDHLSKARKRVKGVDMAHKKMKEDVEQIDEISKKTLGSYIKKAGQSSQQLGDKSIDLMNKGMNNPDKKTASAYMTVSDKKYAKSQRRGKYLNKAVDRLTKEESEELDEISSDLKSRYAKKAQSSLKRATTYKTKARDDAKKASDNISRGYAGDRNVNVDKQYNRLDRADAKIAKHDKTIAKRTAGLKRANEEVEDLGEVSNKTLTNYAKASYNDVLKRRANRPAGKGDEADPKIGQRLKMNALAHKKGAFKEEAEQIDELKKSTLASYIKKASGNMAGNAAVGAAQASSSMKKSDPSVKRDIFKRAKGISRAADKLANESVEQLDELSPNTLHSYIKGAGKDLAKRSRMSGYDDKRGNYADGDKNRKKANKRLAGITSASGRLADKANMAENAWEEVPMMMRQLQFIEYAAGEISDYLSMGIDPEEWFQNKLAGIYTQMMSLHGYAEGEMRMGGDMYGEEVELDEGIKSLYHKMKAKSASRKAGNALDAGNETDFVKHQDKSTYHKLKAGQKVHGVRDKDKFMSYYKKTYGEEVELDESITKMSHGRLKFHMNNKSVPHGSYSWDQMKAERDRRLKTGEGEAYKKAKASMSEEVDLDEATPTRKALTRALQGMKVQPKDKVSVKKAPWEKNEEVNEVTQSAVKRPVNITGPDGKTRTVYRSSKSVERDEHGQDKIRESVELNEAFKAGRLKLDDGSSVTLKKEDAKLLNQMFNDLNSKNRKQMNDTLMSDKAGFEEIVGFAREAL